MNKRLAVVFALGFSSGLPLALVSTTLQAWFADEGASILTTGLLSLLGLPFAYRIILGPLIDRFTLIPIGKRRSWMLIAQIILLFGFNAMAWLSPTEATSLIILTGFLLAIFAASQDTAIDAYRIEYLLPREYSVGASLSVCGYRIAMFVSGGVALIIAKNFGWAFTYRTMGVLMIVGIIATIFGTEQQPISQDKTNFIKSCIEPIKDLFAKPDSIFLLLFILFYKLGEVFTTSSSGIIMPFLLQGIGFPLDTVGYINKLLGGLTTILGGLMAGFFLTRWSLFNALFTFGLLQALTNILFLLLAIYGKNIVLFALAVGCDNFTAGMSTTALVVFFMRLVNKKFIASQFSLLVAMASLPNIFSGPLAAFLQSYFGWVGLYEIALLLSYAFIPFLFSIRTPLIATVDQQLPLSSVS